ncbi:hypothetical protein RGUI_4261 (plasmid) [Rhodovulum sp. P5]|uniref:hypothetical protein n=1 Tax=Rhodovulum sp. P5 TaxID=1564506 RepID=UPI0009C319CE|nr:hypothetical protein [Rhodovulum sp. P5]ARE42287.1 hypothetical protein RGUI_4261 [Rhodovulum sp. P5]
MSGRDCERSLEPGDVPVSNAGFDTLEHAALTVARYYFQSFAFPKSEGWVKGFALAEHNFHPRAVPAKASEVAVAILAAVQEMRAARKSGFRFSNPDCAGCARVLCGPERHFMEVLTALRRGSRSHAHTAALLLCEGNPTQPFLRAMEDLVGPVRTKGVKNGKIS